MSVTVFSRFKKIGHQHLKLVTNTNCLQHPSPISMLSYHKLWSIIEKSLFLYTTVTAKVHRLMRFSDNWTFCTIYFLEHYIIPILAMICQKFFWCAKILIIFRLVCLFLVLKTWNSTNHETKNRSKLTCIRPEINSRKFPKKKSSF